MLESIRSTFTRPRLILFSLIFLATTYFLTSPFHSQSQSAFPKFPNDATYVYPAEPHLHALNSSSKRIAIIGAGASGSSAAWFLNRAAGVVADRLGVDKRELVDEIVVFDRNDYVGGRTTTVYPHGDQRLNPVEIGASVFVQANRHLVKAAKRFGLRAMEPDWGNGGLGIWDGQNMLYSTSTSKSWWSGWLDTASAIRRYGPLSPLRTKSAVSTLLGKFSNLYNPVWLAGQGSAASMDEFSERVGLGKEYTTRKGEEWALGVVKVGVKWMSEIWEGSTRVNYATDMNNIHALGAAVSMATGGAQSIQGGNWRIFDEMLDEAAVTRRLGFEVIDIVPLPHANKFRVDTNDSMDNGEFDQIFFAAPWYTSPRDDGMPNLQRVLPKPFPRTKYVHLHVTVFTTTLSSPSPSFFNLPLGTKLPTTILTSSYNSRSNPDLAIPPPRFNSISWHGETTPGSGEYVVKIFSLSRLTDSFISELLDGENPTWLLRKEWMSYPLLQPLSEFPKVEPIKGLQYLAAMEPWVSTMETQTISAREAVARVVVEWWRLGYGECEGGADAWDWSCEE